MLIGKLSFLADKSIPSDNSERHKRQNPCGKITLAGGQIHTFDFGKFPESRMK